MTNELAVESKWRSIDPFSYILSYVFFFLLLKCLQRQCGTGKTGFFFYISNGFLLSSLSPGILPMLISKCHRNASREMEAFTRTAFSRTERLGDAAGLGSPRELLHYLSHLQMPAPFILLICFISLLHAY